MAAHDLQLSRRQLLVGATATAAGLALSGTASAVAPQRSAPGQVRRGRPAITHGVQSGDVLDNEAIVWARADRASQMWVEVSDTASRRHSRWVRGPAVGDATDFAGKVQLRGLRAGQRISYRVHFADLSRPTQTSEPLSGSFVTAPRRRDADVSFVWTGDCVGQGWGINDDFGGMVCFDAMHDVEPDFFMFSGDTIYADGPLLAEVADPSSPGGIWRNRVEDGKRKVCETLDEFRAAYRYNLLDDNVNRLLSDTSMIAQWDDHEVVNNWYPGEILEYRPEYTIEKRVDVLAARSHQAFFEMMPVRPDRHDATRLYRTISYGPNLDVFVLDMRSSRGANSANLQSAPGMDTAFLGPDQIAWLKHALTTSRATWKVIAADMPIGLWVADYSPSNNPHEPGVQWWEAVANGDDGVAKGRELEIADLLSFLKAARVRNTVWLTADVHYCAAHYYDPSAAASGDFDPFWEFVSGPVNAGTFGPNKLDETFGPRVVFQKAPPAGQANLSPAAGYQFFGKVAIDGHSRAMTVSLVDLHGTVVFSQELAAAGVEQADSD